ncbi:hypothetical protein AJ79_03209 [Helicocarpus griseus UAMH5409]|uniref:Uncharacterized protein n=1 Tax=Helicocarpus griseus UAMH5409 TaxID=1447875 RepID=A0A2B7XR39_9EURO|nr:hypothetical protein AJ79_03209 [Helicocarpus griseus UAMH5409]
MIAFFRQKYQSLDEAKLKLSTPDLVVNLVFPFIGTTIPQRFKKLDQDKEIYEYFGREILSELADTFENLPKRSVQDLSVIFIIDQLDALYGPEEAESKIAIRRWLEACRCRMKGILSTSSDNLTFHKISSRLVNTQLFRVHGGFTSRRTDVDLGAYKREDIENFTGKNPLLLARCTQSKVIDFHCNEILQVTGQSQRFVLRMKSELNEWPFHEYKSFVKACITNDVVPGDILPEHADHRFFMEENGYEYCVCGAVRETITKQLIELGTVLFSVEESIAVMTTLASNSPVMGYFMEQAVIQNICNKGLRCLNFEGPITPQVFLGFPHYGLDLKQAIYIPKAYYDFPPINAILLALEPEKKIATLVPIRITMDKTHRNSEEQFFNNWASWAEDLHGYKINVKFLWITAEDGITEESIVNEKNRVARDGSMRLDLQECKNIEGNIPPKVLMESIDLHVLLVGPAEQYVQNNGVAYNQLLNPSLDNQREVSRGAFRERFPEIIRTERFSFAAEIARLKQNQDEDLLEYRHRAEEIMARLCLQDWRLDLR